MTTQVNGAAFANQVLSADLQYYICYATSPGAFSDPNPNPPENQEILRSINIQVTGNVTDQSQKNFDILVMGIGLRAIPVVMSDPMPVLELSQYPSGLAGEGYIWKFGVERGEQFTNFSKYGTPGPVGLLVDEIDGFVLPSGVRVTTKDNSPTGWAKNITFSTVQFL